MRRQLIKHEGQTAPRHSGIENREYPRVPVFIPVSCVSLDSNFDPIYQSMGAIKDVSQTGVGIEVPCDIRSEYLGLTFVGLDNEIVEIKGKVVFSRVTTVGTSRLGVLLMGGKAEIDLFVAKVVRFHHYTKNVKCAD